MPVTIRIAFNEIPALPGRARAGAAQALMAAGNSIVTSAQSRARVRTGYMRDSTNAAQTGDLTVTVAAPAYYSGFQDLGTRYIAADHWFSGPVQDEAGKLGDDLASIIAGALGG